MPDVRAVVKGALGASPGLEHDDLVALARALWTERVHECRLATVIILTVRRDQLVSVDVSWIEQLLREARTWALVDDLARKVVASQVLRDRALLATLDRWVGDADFWIRRSAVLGLSELLRRDLELDRFFHYGDVLLAEQEFFIRKVLGWVARETGRRHPELVAAWLRRNMTRMNGVTIREAVKYLPDGPDLLAEYRSRR